MHFACCDRGDRGIDTAGEADSQPNLNKNCKHKITACKPPTCPYMCQPWLLPVRTMAMGQGEHIRLDTLPKQVNEQPLT